MSYMIYLELITVNQVKKYVFWIVFFIFPFFLFYFFLWIVFCCSIKEWKIRASNYLKLFGEKLNLVSKLSFDCYLVNWEVFFLDSCMLLFCTCLILWWDFYFKTRIYIAYFHFCLLSRYLDGSCLWFASTLIIKSVIYLLMITEKLNCSFNKVCVLVLWFAFALLLDHLTFLVTKNDIHNMLNCRFHELFNLLLKGASIEIYSLWTYSLKNGWWIIQLLGSCHIHWLVWEKLFVFSLYCRVFQHSVKHPMHCFGIHWSCKCIETTVWEEV